MKAHKSFYYLTTLVAFVDFLCFQAALIWGYWLWVQFPWHAHGQPFVDYSVILWVLPPIAVLVFKAVGLYKPEMGVIGVQEQSLIFKATWIVYMIAFAISFFYRNVQLSRLSVFYSVFVALFLVTATRYAFRRLYAVLHKQGMGVRKVLIYGAGYHGQRLERWIRQSPKLGIQVVGYLDDNVGRLVKKPTSPPWLGGLEEMKQMVQRRNISMLFIAHRKMEEQRIVEVFHQCRDLGIQCWAIPALYRFHVERVKLTNIGGIPLVGFPEGIENRAYLIIKRMLDVVLGLSLIVLLLPLAAFIAVGVRISSPGPIFFIQTRVGRNGKRFRMFKFRTLIASRLKPAFSPELSRAAKKTLSRFSSFLRRSGLDETPQLLNVICGDMSLVGPRPEMPFIVKRYGPLERERLTVPPGITGLLLQESF